MLFAFGKESLMYGDQPMYAASSSFDFESLSHGVDFGGDGSAFQMISGGSFGSMDLLDSTTPNALPEFSSNFLENEAKEVIVEGSLKRNNSSNKDIMKDFVEDENLPNGIGNVVVVVPEALVPELNLDGLDLTKKLSHVDILRFSSREFDQYVVAIERLRRIPVKERKELVRQRRLIKNRESAQASRNKRKNYIDQLEREVAMLKERNLLLVDEMEQLRRLVGQDVDDRTSSSTSSVDYTDVDVVEEPLKKRRRRGEAFSNSPNLSSGSHLFLVVLLSFGLLFGGLESVILSEYTRGIVVGGIEGSGGLGLGGFDWEDALPSTPSPGRLIHHVDYKILSKNDFNILNDIDREGNVQGNVQDEDDLFLTSLDRRLLQCSINNPNHQDVDLREVEVDIYEDHSVNLDLDCGIGGDLDNGNGNDEDDLFLSC